MSPARRDGDPSHYHHLVPATTSSICRKAGLDARPQKTRRYFAGHQDVYRTCYSVHTRCAGAARTNDRCRLLIRSWHSAAGMGGNGLGPSAVSQRAETRSIYGVWGGGKNVSLSICRSCVTILSAIEVHRFYEMCHGSMNNPALKHKGK